MDLLKYLKSKKWHLLGSWNHPTILADLVCGSVSDKNFPRVVNYAPTGYLMIGTHQCVIDEEYKDHIKKTLKLLKKDLLGMVRKIKVLIHTTNKRTYSNNYKTLDYPKVKKFLSDIAWHGPNWYQIMLIDNALQVLYPKSLPDNFILNGETETLESVLAKAALPKKMFPMVKERNNLLQIAVDIKKGKNVEKKLIAHTKKYRWMNSMNWWLEPFTISYYLRKARELAKKDPKKLLSELSMARQEQYRLARKILKELKKKYPRAWQYLDIIRDLADLKEENWDAVSITGTRLREALTELAQKYGLTYREFMMMNRSEMLRTLKTNELSVPVNELKLRTKGYGVIYAVGKGYVVSGSEVRQYAGIILAKPRETEEIKEIKGMVVWRGRETGKVCVLPTSHELSKMKANGILICPMTDPDYMPAIHKAKAIVTDQGGLLCHAAIVARELQIPCIVGTKFATRIFKDGDLVEVDANKGIIKILKR